MLQWLGYKYQDEISGCKYLLQASLSFGLLRGVIYSLNQLVLRDLEEKSENL